MAKVHDTLGAAGGAREIIFENAVYDIKTTQVNQAVVYILAYILDTPQTGDDWPSIWD